MGIHIYARTYQWLTFAAVSIAIGQPAALAEPPSYTVERVTAPWFFTEPEFYWRHKNYQSFSLSESGDVVFKTDRYQVNGSPTDIGEDTWLFDGSQTNQLGLLGTTHFVSPTNG